MKTILAITIYILFKDLPLDAILGIVAGASFAMICVLVFVGPTPTPKSVTPKVNKTRKPRRIIEQTAPTGWTFTPVNYPQGAYA